MVPDQPCLSTPAVRPSPGVIPWRGSWSRPTRSPRFEIDEHQVRSRADPHERPEGVGIDGPDGHTGCLDATKTTLLASRSRIGAMLRFPRPGCPLRVDGGIERELGGCGMEHGDEAAMIDIDSV